MEEIKSLILRITERCNLRCDYCYAAGSQCNVQDMSIETAIRAVELCCPEGSQLRIQFTGGEPLLNLEVMEAVFLYGKATNRRLHLAVQTNGTLLTKATCRKLATMKCAVGVSLDGINEANALRHFPDGTPAWEPAVEGIRRLGQWGIRCNLTTVVTSQNARHLGQIPDLALWLGNVSGVGLDLFRPLGRGLQQNLAPGEEDLISGLAALSKKAGEIRAAGIPFRFREVERLRKRMACSGCESLYCYAQTEQSLCVDSDGNCWPCSSLAGATGFYLGNLKDGLPRSSPCRSGLAAPETCKNCEQFSLCAGGCPAGRTAFAEKPDRSTCIMNRTLLEELRK